MINTRIEFWYAVQLIAFYTTPYWVFKRAQARYMNALDAILDPHISRVVRDLWDVRS